MATNYGQGLYGDGLYGVDVDISVVLATDLPMSPGYQVSVFGLSGVVGASYFTVNRQSTSAAATGPIRGMDQLPITTDSETQTDYEYSFLESFYYELKIYNASNVLLSNAISPTFSGRDAVTAIKSAVDPYWPQVLIRSTSQPELNQLVQIANFSGWSIPGRILGTNTILGRPNPVVYTDKSGGRTGSFTVLIAPNTNMSDPQQSLELLLTYGDTLMFQCLYFDPRFKDMFFKVSDISVERTTMAGYAESETESMQTAVMTYAVSFTEVDRPSTAGETFAILTWQDVLDAYPTWQAVLDANVTWLNVLNRPTG